MTEAAFWWVHTGQVHTYQGSGPYGDVYDPPLSEAGTSVACWVEGEQKVVTNTEGTEVTSMTVVRGPLTDKDLLAVGSKFTYGGQTAKVLTLAWFDSGSLDLGLDHYEARLT